MNTLPYELRPDLPAQLSDLRRLALDIRWSWSHVADQLWSCIDNKLWQQTHNPWMIMQTVSIKRLNELVQDKHFNQLLKQLHDEQNFALNRETWFSQKYPQSHLNLVAYFCMEYGLSEALPLYSGGLGVLAGDHLKTSNDLGIPLVAVGLLYQQGYFRQTINRQGEQREFYPFNDPSQMPVTPVRDENGEWLNISIQFPGRLLRLRTWQVQIGRITLYLLDSNDPLNNPADRGITSELYGGDTELRLKQEMVLGIGGYSLLNQLGLQPEVCHLNEGHAAFAILERARLFMQEQDVNFSTALMATRAGNLFTTHTPVEAGFDRFDNKLVQYYLSPWAEHCGIDLSEILVLGKSRTNSHEAFNMAWLAIHGSIAVNGVSKLHGKVSRTLFQSLFPRWPAAEVPVGHITNGVHIPSWDSAKSDQLWTEVCGKERWREELQALRASIMELPDDRLWEMRLNNRLNLIQWIRQRQPEHQAIYESDGDVLDPNVLTLGFARRFATYKRPNLLLHDPDRLARLLTRFDQPVQIVIAGKAHPKDFKGQTLIQQWIRFIQDYKLGKHLVFLVDYDLLIAEQLVAGVDLWLNTPRRPWEASGTSGMKVLVNGGLNFAELDGWWAEAYNENVGWVLGDGQEHDSDPAWDAHEAEILYDTLEQKIIPAFYQRNQQGIPEQWLKLMRHSMAELTPQFSTNRMLREYTENYYLPLAEQWYQRCDNKGQQARIIHDWHRQIRQYWSAIHFSNLEILQNPQNIEFKVQLYLGELNPEFIKVELYAEAAEKEEPERHTLQRMETLIGAVNSYLYRLEIQAHRPVEDYTLRVIPYHPDVVVPLECNLILWQH